MTDRRSTNYSIRKLDKKMLSACWSAYRAATSSALVSAGDRRAMRLAISIAGDSMRANVAADTIRADTMENTQTIKLPMYPCGSYVCM